MASARTLCPFSLSRPAGERRVGGAPLVSLDDDGWGVSFIAIVSFFANIRVRVFFWLLLGVTWLVEGWWNACAELVEC